MSGLINSLQSRAQNLTVAKFGGTSVADFQAMLRCANIIKNDPSNRLVVVSASAGVTNHLVRLSQPNVQTDEREKLIADIERIQAAIIKHFDQAEQIQNEIGALVSRLHACSAHQAHEYTP